MGIDSYFVIGSAHAAAGLPCQDYASHGIDYGVIADGCSSSMGNPDIGARIAASALSKALALPVNDPGIPQQTLLERLQVALDSSLVTREDLLTTVGGFRVDGERIQVWLWGDGVVYVEYADGATDCWVVEWAENAPMYPVYLLDPEPHHLQASINGEPVTGVIPFYRDLGNSGRAAVRKLMLATDGMLQLSGVSVKEALAELTAFRTIHGAFLKRRSLRALREMFPIDDLAMVAYHENIC